MICFPQEIAYCDIPFHARELRFRSGIDFNVRRSRDERVARGDPIPAPRRDTTTPILHLQQNAKLWASEESSRRPWTPSHASPPSAPSSPSPSRRGLPPVAFRLSRTATCGAVSRATVLRVICSAVDRCWIHLPASSSRGSCKTKDQIICPEYNTRKKMTSRNT